MESLPFILLASIHTSALHNVARATGVCLCDIWNAGKAIILQYNVHRQCALKAGLCAVMAQRRGEFLQLGMLERLASLRPELQAKVDSLQDGL